MFDCARRAAKAIAVRHRHVHVREGHRTRVRQVVACEHDRASRAAVDRARAGKACGESQRLRVLEYKASVCGNLYSRQCGDIRYVRVSYVRNARLQRHVAGLVSPRPSVGRSWQQGREAGRRDDSHNVIECILHHGFVPFLVGLLLC